jgi:hypothetical protein
MLPGNIVEGALDFLAQRRAEAEKNPSMKAKIDAIDEEEAKRLAEAEAASISAARDTRRILQEQEKENKKADAHRTHVEERLEENADNQKTILKQTKRTETLIKRAVDPQGLVAKNDRLEQQVLEGQQREKRYRTERDAARTESAKLKKEIAALEKSNDDKDRKIAALERQLAAASTK